MKIQAAQLAFRRYGCCIGCGALSAGVRRVRRRLRSRNSECSGGKEAAIEQAKTPHSDTHETTSPGKPSRQVAMIFTRGKCASRSMDVGAPATLNAAEAWGGQRPELSPHSCEKISREAIDGEATSLQIVHSETNGKPKEARIWIADKSGLPLKSEAHLSDGKTVNRQVYTQPSAVGAALIPAVVAAVVRAISLAVPVTVAEWVAGVGLV